MTPAANSPAGQMNLPDGTFKSMLETAAREVFETMVGTKLEETAAEGQPKMTDLTAIVGLAGQLRGVLSLRCTAQAAGRMASKMLNTDELQPEDNIRDTIGELCNMVAGSFKTKIAKMVTDCLISVPTVISGEDYELYSLARDEECIQKIFGFEGMALWVTLDLDRHNPWS